MVRAHVVPVWLCVVFVVIVTRIVIGWINGFDTSMWASIAPATKMFLGVIGIITTPVIMPWYLANGVTRRNFVEGVAIVLACTALICSIVIMIGFAIEQAIYYAAGISSALENVDVYGSASRAAIVFVSFVLLNAAWFCSGWLIGAGYYRYGGIAGTALLPIMLLPLAITEHLIAIEWGWDPTEASGAVGIVMSVPGRITGDLEIPFIAGALLATVLLAASVRLGFQTIRSVPIK